MTKLLALLLVAGALAPATGAFAVDSPSSGSVSIQLAEGPVSRRDDPRASIYVIDHVKPGTTVSRKFVVGDKATAPLQVAVYPAAADIKDGQFIPQDGRAVNELSSWTTVSEPSVSLSPGASRTLVATIAVPADAAPGERYAVVWAEVAGAATEGVRQVTRVGIRLYLSVGPGGEPASDFTIDTLTANRLPDGTPVVYALVHNTGGRALDMSGGLRLTNGPGGLSAGPFTAKLGTTLGVKDTEPVTVQLDKALPAGPWTARIDLVSGLTKKSAQATVTFPDAAGPGTEVSAQPVAVAPTPTDGGLPVVPLAAAGAVAAALGLSFALFKRPRKRGGHARGGHRAAS